MCFPRVSDTYAGRTVKYYYFVVTKVITEFQVIVQFEEFN